MNATEETLKDSYVEDKRITWEEAKEKDLVNSMYFTPEVNLVYVLTFKDAYNTERSLPVWKNNVKTDKSEPKVVLVLKIETVNGKAVPNQEWSVINPAWREKFEPYAVQDQLLKTKFQVKVKQNGNKKELNLAAIGPK